MKLVKISSSLTMGLFGNIKEVVTIALSMLVFQVCEPIARSCYHSATHFGPDGVDCGNPDSGLIGSLSHVSFPNPLLPHLPPSSPLFHRSM